MADQVLSRPRRATPSAPRAEGVSPVLPESLTSGEVSSCLLANGRAAGPWSVFPWWRKGVSCCLPSNKLREMWASAQFKAHFSIRACL